MRAYFLGFVALAMQLGGSALLDATSPAVCPRYEYFCSSWGFTGWALRGLSLVFAVLAIFAWEPRR